MQVTFSAVTGDTMIFMTTALYIVAELLTGLQA